MNNQDGGELSLKKTPEHNDPHMPNEQKKIFQKKIENKNYEKDGKDNKTEVFKKTNKPLAELTLYQQQHNPKKQDIPPLMYPMSNPFYYPPYNQQNLNGLNMLNNQIMPPYGLQYFYPYVSKKYNISTPNPNGSHEFMSSFYSDILPDSIFGQTSNTLDERILRLNYLRRKFTKLGDGEDISLNTNIKNGILNRIKLQTLNPQADNILSSNPYKDLSYGFLIYNSCYPMEYNKAINNTRCSKNSTGLNIRIYELNIVDYNAFKLKQHNKENFDSWRDIIYYEYIRKEILEKKLCPNFVMLYTYHIDHNCDINFDKLYNISGAYQKDKEKILKLIEEELNPSEPITMDGGNNVIKEKLSKNFECKTKGNNINKSDMISLQIDKERKALVAITESPTYNIYKWASEQYEYDGILKEMVYNGYHKDEVWLSILFQLMVALYAMQIKKIYIKNFSLEDNVYIKDINVKDMKNGHWIYNIDDIDYYIPNYGYIVLIDSKYKDMETDNTLQSIPANKNFKIEGKCMNSTGNISEEVFKIFQQCLNINNFGLKRKNIGFNPPSNNILDLLNKMNNDSYTNIFNNEDIYNDKINKKIIGYYIHKYMKKYLHNRIGSFPSEDEKKNFAVGGNINIGSIIYNSRNNLLGICTGYATNIHDNDQYIICSKDKNKNFTNFIISKIDDRIHKYSDYVKDIEQLYDGEPNFNNTLEKYRLHINMSN